MDARTLALEAHRALLNGSGKLGYFERRGISRQVIQGAYVGFRNGAFTYPCIGKSGGLLAIHCKSEARDGKGKRRQWWKGYADDLPQKGHGKNPDKPAKVIPFGLETLKNVETDSLVILCCGEEDALSLRQIGHVALSQPGAGLLEPVYAREMAGLNVVVFYDAGEEQEARKDGLKLLDAGARSVRVVEWPPDSPNGADINGKLVEQPEDFAEWVEAMVSAAHPTSEKATATGLPPANRIGEPDHYSGNSPVAWNGKSVEAGPVGRLLSEIVPERVDWLWPGRIPKGKLTICEGDPGEGKSAMTTDFAARVSVGSAWPDGTECEAGGVVLCSAEDGEADTIRPRLDAAGGDASKVLTLATIPDGASERLLSIPEDLGIIRRGIDRVQAALVVIDPLSAFLSGNVNSHRDQDVRRALAPLAKLAEETGAAVIVVRHLNQSKGGNPLYRGQGSIGIVGAARSALLVAKHPEDEQRRVLASLKSNLAKPAPSLTFALLESDNGAVRVEWKGETPHTAAALLAAPTDPEERSALDEAAEFLRDTLRGGPVWSMQVKNEAREADISEITLKRAKDALGVRSQKEGDGSWSWTLPEKSRVSQSSQDDPLDTLDPLPTDRPDSGGRDGKPRRSYEPLEESAVDKPDFGPRHRQGDQEDHVSRDERLEQCIHGYAGGKGCYLCDSEHLYRRKQRRVVSE
jgi:hypothetical protein